MFFTAHTNFFSKYLFSILVAASLAIHALIIVLSPQANQILSLRSFRESFIRDPGDYAVALEFEDTDTQREVTIVSDDKQSENEIKKKEDPEKKKDKLFVDTSDNAEDEETSADTDKIGEKGSVAKDNFPDDKQPVNNEPHAEGHSKAPLLGKGGAILPKGGQQQPQGQQVIAPALVPVDPSHDKSSPPRFANLPEGLEKLEEPVKHLQKSQPKVLTGKDEKKTTERESVKSDKTKETEGIVQTTKRQQGNISRDIRREEETELLSAHEEVIITGKQNEAGKESETEEPPTQSNRGQETVKKEKEDVKDLKDEKLSEIKEVENAEIPDSENPIPPAELSGNEPQRRLERGLDEQESPGEIGKPKVSINVNAKAEGANNDPVLFEDTISNAAIPGAPSFNVKKHEYASYFKYIRDRISLYWFLGYGTRAEIKLETRDDKPIIIEFKVLPDGSLEDVKIVDDAGNFHLASRLVSSIKNAAPLNPFPPNIKEPSIEVRFNFYFF